MKTYLSAAVVASSLVLGTTSLAFAQQGVGNLPSPSGITNQTFSGDVVNGTSRASTTGYSDRQDRDVPAGWRVVRPPFVGAPAFDR
jgi:hypothetical protein